MRTRIAAWIAAAALAALPAAANAGAPPGKLAGAGLIGAVDLARQTLGVGDQTLLVTSDTILLDGEGRHLSLAAFKRLFGEHALYYADKSYPHPILRQLSLVDPEAADGQ